MLSSFRTELIPPARIVVVDEVMPGCRPVSEEDMVCLAESQSVRLVDPEAQFTSTDDMGALQIPRTGDVMSADCLAVAVPSADQFGKEAVGSLHVILFRTLLRTRTRRHEAPPRPTWHLSMRCMTDTRAEGSTDNADHHEPGR
jgi:hypothetical protein